MKKILVCLLVVTQVLFFASCGGSAGGRRAKLYISYTADDFRTAFAEAAIAEANAQGVEVIDGGSDDTVEKQVESIKNAVASGCTAILCIPVNSATAQQLEVAANGVPIIFCNSAPDEEYMKANQYIYVGSSEAQAGAFQAERLMELNPGKNEFNIVMFKGVKDHSGTVGRESGFKNTMRENGMTVNYVFDDYADWTGEIAVSKFKQFLKTGQDYDAVVCHNDTMAVAVAEYMASKGIKKPVFGIDATADGIAALEKDELVFTVYQSAKGQGKAAVQAGILLSRGESVKSVEGVDDTETYIFVPFEPVDKSNAQNYK